MIPWEAIEPHLWWVLLLFTPAWLLLMGLGGWIFDRNKPPPDPALRRVRRAEAFEADITRTECDWRCEEARKNWGKLSPGTDLILATLGVLFTALVVGSLVLSLIH